ncbi:uncharacterized protein METZ01_LOCUS249467 [marine metagenome]|uniref:Uncharacterized protein n=1 Tax=marine metagenome TaxID=408172 RepID=A0A382ICI8_9ZZZZ
MNTAVQDTSADARRFAPAARKRGREHHQRTKPVMESPQEDGRAVGVVGFLTALSLFRALRCIP